MNKIDALKIIADKTKEMNDKICPFASGNGFCMLNDCVHFSEGKVVKNDLSNEDEFIAKLPVCLLWGIHFERELI